MTDRLFVGGPLDGQTQWVRMIVHADTLAVPYVVDRVTGPIDESTIRFDPETFQITAPTEMVTVHRMAHYRMGNDGVMYLVPSLP